MTIKKALKNSFLQKKVLIFDLDGTLTKSKMSIDKQMARLLCRLLAVKKVAIIGGGKFSQLQKQFLAGLNCPQKLFKNLLLLPTNGAQMWQYKNSGWQMVYKHEMSTAQKKKVFFALKKALAKTGFTKPAKTYGKIIEDRGAQITFSALGQKAPLKNKAAWNAKHNNIRRAIKSALEKLLPGFEVRLGGLTSIDILKKGRGKAYGVKQVMKAFKAPLKTALYVGDALYKGGNDYVVKKTGIETLAVKNEAETKKLIRQFIKL